MMAQEKQSTEWHDWVGELFVPSIDVGTEAILQDVDKDNAVRSRIKRVSTLDPEHVQKIYEKVHMMTVLDREMKEKGDVSSTLKEETDSKPEKRSQEIDLNDSCIWSSEEIGVLRQVMKTIKEKNMQLSVRNKELEKRNSQLEQKNKIQMEEIEQSNVKLREVLKANSRLKIHCEHLQTEFDSTNARMTAMEQVFKEVSEERASMAKEVQKIRVNSDKERMDKAKIELKLESLQREALSEKMSAIESIKIQCQGEIQQLNQQIRDLTAELNKEKKLHRNTKKALDHLRNHFASLPISHIIPPNSVQEDQVQHFKYS